MLISFFEMKRTKKVQIVVYCIFISALHTHSEKVSGFYSSEEQGEKILIDPSKGMRTKKS